MLCLCRSVVKEERLIVTTRSMTERQEPKCTLLALPPEVRNRIYETVSISHEGNKEPSFFSTCHQIRDEGLKLFYATHTFCFNLNTGVFAADVATNYHHFLTSIGSQKASILEHLCFTLYQRFADSPVRASIMVGVHATGTFAHESRFVSGDMSEADERLLGALKDALNTAWGKVSNPTKAGFLRTLPGLVPRHLTVD